jgi:hypothetical protein
MKILCSVATFIVPVWGDKVNFGIVLSYQPARLAGRSQLYPPVRDYEFGYSRKIADQFGQNSDYPVKVPYMEITVYAQSAQRRILSIPC